MAYQPKSYRKFVATAATATLVASAIAPVASAAADASKFTDVSSNYKEAVEFVVSKGANGLTETTFGTSSNIKRVDAAVLLVNVLGLDTTDAPESGFTDVPTRAAKHVNALKAAGIASGKTTTSFGSDAHITRGELAIWIARAFDLQGDNTSELTDATGIYKDAIDALVTNKVTSGKTATTFGTSDNATRGEYAIFLMKADKASAPIETPDTEAPVLSYDGETTINVVNGASFTAPVVTAKDNKDETVEVTSTITNAAGETVEAIDTKVAGKYTITYNAKDAAGNAAESLVVTVNVAEAPLAVESVSAITAKSLKVEFNKATDVKSADFSVTKGTAKANIASVTIAEDKKSATIELSSKLTAGEYTVKVAQNDAEALTGTVKVENEKVTEIKVLSDVAVLSTDKETATVGYQVLNQYGEDVTKANYNNLVVTAAGVSVKSSAATVTAAGLLTVALNEDTAKVDDVVSLTLVDKVTATVGSATVKLSSAAIASEVEVGEVYNKDGKTLNQDTAATDKFYLPVTVKDQYGKVITNPVTAKDALVVTNTNGTVASVDTDFETITINGKSTLALEVKPATYAGTTSVVLVVKATGKTTQATINVAAGRSVANIALGAPTNDVVVAGEAIKFPLTLTDNEGNEIKTLKEYNAIKSARALNDLDTDNTGLSIKEADGGLYLEKAASKVTEGPTSVVVSTKSGKAATQIVTVKAAPVATTIVGINPKNLATSIRENGSALTFNKNSFVFEDQYGRVIGTGNAAAPLEGVTVSAATALEEKSPFTITGDSIVLNPASTVTSDKITFVISSLEASKQAASAFTQTFTVVKDAALASYSVAELEATVKVTRVPGSTVTYTEDGNNPDSPYATDDVTVYGHTAAGEKVELVEGEYTAVYPTLTDADFPTVNGVQTKTVTKEITITINATGEVIKVPVTYSIATPAIEKVEVFEKGTVGDETYKAISELKVPALSTGYGLTELLADADFNTTNQYGVEAILTSADVASVTYSIVSGKATFSKNGAADATITNAEAGTVVKATIGTKNGKSVSINVKLEAGDTVAPKVASVSAYLDNDSMVAGTISADGNVSIVLEQGTVTENIVVTFSEAVTLTNDGSALATTNDLDINVTVGTSTTAYGKATLSADKKELTITPASTNVGTMGAASATFTMVDFDGFKDAVGNEGTIGTITVNPAQQ